MMYVDICVDKKSTDVVESRWRDIDPEGVSMSLYLPLLPVFPQKRLRTPLSPLNGSCLHVSGQAKLSPYLAA